MGKTHSMDIGIKFDFQEVKNAVEQAKKEVLTRYDLKDAGIEIVLTDDHVRVKAENEMHLESVYGILVKKFIARGQAASILERKNIEKIGGMMIAQNMVFVKALSKENLKKVSNLVRENFAKAKPAIQGEKVRVTSASIDILQAIIKFLSSGQELELPLDFGNFK
jgi:uncharacterized protein YajQ (UPF0234 family)